MNESLKFGMTWRCVDESFDFSFNNGDSHCSVIVELH